MIISEDGTCMLISAILVQYVMCKMFYAMFLVIFNAGSVPVPLSGGTAQYTAGSIGYPLAGGVPTGVSPVAPGFIGVPDVAYNPMTDRRSPVPPAPVLLSSLPVNLSSPPSQPPLYQPSPLPVGTIPVPGTSAPTDPMSGIGGPPPPPPTEGFVPSHGIVTATPGKVSCQHC